MTEHDSLNDEESETFLDEDGDIIGSDVYDVAIDELRSDLGKISRDENSSKGFSSAEDEIPLNIYYMYRLQVLKLFITDGITGEIIQWPKVEINQRSCINSTD